MTAKLYKGHAFVADPWVTVGEGEAVSPAGHSILSLAQWEAERTWLLGTQAPIGVRIEPGASVAAVIADLDRFSVIALAFPKFADGRAFSNAVILREQRGFRGELRAVGDVLFDQLQMMARCGFDAFEISDAATLRALERGDRPGVALFCQPGYGAEAPVDTRPWARRPVKGAPAPSQDR